MKKVIKYTGLLLIVVSAMSCANSNKSGCYYSYEESSLEQTKSDSEKTTYVVHHKEEEVAE